MKVTHIPFQKTGFFSKMMSDYLEKNETLAPFYHNYPDLEGFAKQIEEKQAAFTHSHRKPLVEVLKQQYQNVSTSEKTANHIDSLLNPQTFTITTGHQLNLFTGPLYFLYKIISTINLCETLKDAYPQHNFVPIYWMATEDHDFDEINFFKLKGKQYQWDRENAGAAVGRFDTKGLEEVYHYFASDLGNSKNAEWLKQLFSDAYFKHNTLAEATRYIANSLFGEYGLVIIDADNPVLKTLFMPYLQKEVTEQVSFKEVSKTIAALQDNYKVQVNPREINLFYLGEHTRERILYDGKKFTVNNTSLEFTEEEILKAIEENPSAFSPNVIVRPLYQEVILPNLCYIGGGGELAYWMQFKSYFEKVGVPFPILLLRNSVQVFSEKKVKKLSKLGISKESVFTKQLELIAEKVKENADISIDFEEKKTFLAKQFQELKETAKKTDITFANAVDAQERKQRKGLEKLEKRLLKAEKRRQRELVERITNLQNEILPNQALEERQRNFSEYYLAYGDAFIRTLKEQLNPLSKTFTLLEM